MSDRSGAPPAPWMRDTLREGYSLLARGRFREAAGCCQRLLGAKPDLVEAHFLVGLVAQETHDVRTAVNAFGSVTTLQPEHGAAWAQLARLFLRMGHVRRADEALNQAVVRHDGNPVVQDLIATCYSLLGDQEEAGAWLDRAVAQRPRHVPFLVNLANNRMFRGELDEAETAVRRALSERPDNANAHWLLANLRRAGDRSHVAELEALAADARRDHRSRAFLYYALGKELEDLESWDEAFQAFSRGAAARRRTITYDEAAEAAMFEALTETLTEAWLSNRPPGDASPAPVFVVGQPRTGTTLVEQIISSHSQVYSAGELRQFGGCIRRLSDYQGESRDSAALVRAAAAVEPRRLGAAYLATTERLRGGKPRFVDKLPTNYRYLPLILAALPRAKIVHLRRDPMDACFASFKQLFADAYPHSYDQAEMARHHARYHHLMDTWRSRFGGRYLEVAYEDVAREPEIYARRLIEFLELPWEDACLEFHSRSRTVTTASAVQVREPVHTRSVGRWRRYHEHLGVMRETLERHGIETIA